MWKLTVVLLISSVWSVLLGICLTLFLVFDFNILSLFCFLAFVYVIIDMKHWLKKSCANKISYIIMLWSVLLVGLWQEWAVWLIKSVYTTSLHQVTPCIRLLWLQWTRKPCCRKGTARCRSCCFLKFADSIHYKFKSSQASKVSLLSSKRTGAKQNLTQNGDSRSRVLESVERR